MPLLPEHGFKCYLLVTSWLQTVRNLLQKESLLDALHYTQKGSFWERPEYSCVRSYSKKEGLSDQGSGGRFSWQKHKQMLSCFDFFPVAFLANKRKKLNLVGGQFKVVHHTPWKS